MWFVINLWGDPHDEPGRLRAATRFLVFTVLGSALMLVGFLLVHAGSGTFDITRVAASYDRGGALAVGAAVLVGLGLAVKTPLWPLHIWLPDAHSKAPTVGSVVLAGGAAQARHLRPDPLLDAGHRPVAGSCSRRSRPGSRSSASSTPRWPAWRRPTSSG